METKIKFKIERNTGFLHVASDKTKEESPDFFGTMDIDGILYRLAGWKKTGEGKDSTNFIALNLDMESWDNDSANIYHAEALERFKKDRKKPENKGVYTLIDWTGTIHKAKQEKKEDFFGTVKIGEDENAMIRYIKGYATKSKSGAPVIRLEVSDGTRTKEERSEIADSIL